MKRKYDTTFIIDGNLPDSERQALIERFAVALRSSGGEIDQIVRWGQRSLAYPINKRSHGYYAIFYYHAEPEVIATFERQLRLNEFILRYMTLVFDGTHPDYIRDEGSSDTDSTKTAPVSAVATIDEVENDDDLESTEEDENDESDDILVEEEMESDLVIDEEDAQAAADSTDKEKE